MSNMTILSSVDGKWWSVYCKAKSTNYSSLIEYLKFDRSDIKKLKLKLRKGKGEKLCYESLRFKYKKCWYKVINSGNEEYDIC